MFFHHKQRNIENLNPQLNLNEQIIKRVTDFDFLVWQSISILHGMGMSKKIEQDIKITRDYAQIKTISTPKYIESLI